MNNPSNDPTPEELVAFRASLRAQKEAEEKQRLEEKELNFGPRDSHRSAFTPKNRPGRARTTARHLDGDFDNPGKDKAKFWAEKGKAWGRSTTTIDQINANIRFGRTLRRGPPLTKEQIRLLWIKRRHQEYMLKKKYPEIDWGHKDRADAALRVIRIKTKKPL